MELMIIAVLDWLSAVTGAGATDELSNRTLLAAEAQARWAYVSAVVSACSLLISFGALIGLFRSLDQTRRTLKVTRELGETQARAYVEASDVQFSEDIGCILVSCKNSGQTPSRYIAIGLEAVLTDKINMDRALIARSETPPQKSWAALGAGGTFTAKLTPRTGHNSVQNWLRASQIKDARLLIYGTIIYSDVFEQYFKTEFAFFTHQSAGRGFLRPHRDLPAYRPLTSDEYNRWLAMDV